jgi:hypothetical protein
LAFVDLASVSAGSGLMAKMVQQIDVIIIHYGRLHPFDVKLPIIHDGY